MTSKKTVPEIFKEDSHLAAYLQADGRPTLYANIVLAIEAFDADLTYCDIVGNLELVKQFYLNRLSGET